MPRLTNMPLIVTTEELDKIRASIKAVIDSILISHMIPNTTLRLYQAICAELQKRKEAKAE